MKGSVRVRNGTLYAVISYKDNLGQYKQKWISTGLKERGNKKQAQKILETELEKFTLHPSSKYESANAINQALTQTKKEKQADDKNKQKTRQELEDEILHLQQLIKEQEEQERIEKELEEKRKQKKRQQAEM